MMREGHLGGYFHGGDPATWSPKLWTWLVQNLRPTSVMDLGCGEGQSTRFFRDLGCEVVGVEGSPVAIANSPIPEAMVHHDICAGPYVPSKPVDMIWSCEFLEHIDESHLPSILKTMNAAAKFVVMTHAFPGQKGHHHVNCQPNRYWVSLLGVLGFRLNKKLTREARRITLAEYRRVNHFARSGLILERTGTPHANWEQLTAPELAEIARRPSAATKLASTRFWLGYRFARLRKKLARERKQTETPTPNSPP